MVRYESWSYEMDAPAGMDFPFICARTSSGMGCAVPRRDSASVGSGVGAIVGANVAAGSFGAVVITSISLFVSRELLYKITDATAANTANTAIMQIITSFFGFFFDGRSPFSLLYSASRLNSRKNYKLTPKIE